MIAPKFSGLYRFSAPASAFEVEQRALHERHGKRPPYDSALSRLEHALNRQAVSDAQHQRPLTSLHTTRPATGDTASGHEGVLISGHDAPAFWSQAFPEVFSQTRFDEYQRLQARETETEDAYFQTLEARREILDQVRGTRRAKALKVPGLRKLLTHALFFRQNRDFKALGSELEEKQAEKRVAYEARREAHDAFRADTKRLQAEDAEAFQQALWTYVAQTRTDVQGQPRQTIVVPAESAHD